MKTITKITGVTTESANPIRHFVCGQPPMPAMRRRRFTPDGLVIMNLNSKVGVLFPWAELEAAAVAAEPKVKPD